MARKEHSGYARSAKEPDVPRTMVVHVGKSLESETGQGRLDSGEADDVLGVRCREAEACAATDVLAKDVNGARADVLDEMVQVLGCDHLAVLGVGVAGVAEPAEVEGEDPVSPREQRNQFAPTKSPASRAPAGSESRRCRMET